MFSPVSKISVTVIPITVIIPLSNYLSKKKQPFENDQLRIERKPFLTKLERPDLPTNLFWDMKYAAINWQQSYRIVIESVLTRGDEKDLGIIIAFYGKEKIIGTLKNEIGYLPELIIDKVWSDFHSRFI